jgi:hypothetical protein
MFVPVGSKDMYGLELPFFDQGLLLGPLANPELANFMEDSMASKVPAFTPLRVPTHALGQYDFRNGQGGFYGMRNDPSLTGTMLDPTFLGPFYLLGPNDPRSLDLFALFLTGIFNLPPYQLDVNVKNGDVVAAGKPFAHNYMPVGDMLRVNMAVPITNRSDPEFSSLGLIQAAVLGLTDSRFNTNSNLEFIPNMDGFPNGRRLEDDVTRIELQVVSGVVLAAIGFGFDDYDPANGNIQTPMFDDVVGFDMGVNQNDRPLMGTFPYLAPPFAGTQ